jgi:predicted XRE-type DNA-binding protein
MALAGFDIPATACERRPPMSQTQQLVETLKRILKTKAITYAQIAAHLGLSEASVKRQFSQLSFRLRTLEAICERASWIWPSSCRPPKTRSWTCTSCARTRRPTWSPIPSACWWPCACSTR